MLCRQATSGERRTFSRSFAREVCVSVWAIVRAIVLLGVGILLWLGWRTLHAGRLRASRPGSIYEQAHVLRVPHWLSLLCTRPLPGDELELVAMILQIGSLLFALVVVPAIVLRREIIMYIVLSATFSAAVVAQVVISIVRRRKQ